MILAPPRGALAGNTRFDRVEHYIIGLHTKQLDILLAVIPSKIAAPARRRPDRAAAQPLARRTTRRPTAKLATAGIHSGTARSVAEHYHLERPTRNSSREPFYCGAARRARLPRELRSSGFGRCWARPRAKMRTAGAVGRVPPTRRPVPARAGMSGGRLARQKKRPGATAPRLWARAACPRSGQTPAYCKIR